MSLGRLLTSGRSLIGLHSPNGRYAMRRKNLLPRFGSEGNPFSSNRPEPLSHGDSEKFQIVSRTLVSSPESTEPGPTATTGACTERALVAEAAPMPAPRPVAASGAMSKRSSFRWSFGAWLRRLNPGFWFRKQGSAAAGRVAAAAAPGPVQGELSLENVRVVRNDLNEAETEMVQARVVATNQEPPSAPVDQTPELIKT